MMVIAVFLYPILGVKNIINLNFKNDNEGQFELIQTSINDGMPEFCDKNTKFGIMGVELWMKEDEVKALLGVPKTVEKEFYENYGADVFKYYYEFGWVQLVHADDGELYVIHAFMDVPNFKGPYNIQVGDSVKKILGGRILEFNFEKEIYLYGEDRTTGEYATVSYSEEGEISSVLYVCRVHDWLIFHIEHNKIEAIEMLDFL